MPLFDGDAKADPAVYRSAYGTRSWLNSTANRTTYAYVGWGGEAQGDRPVLGDFDGDGRTDPTVYRPATGTWFNLESATGFADWHYFGWGVADDIRVPTDYDHDGRTDAAIYRPSTGTWDIRGSGALGQVAIEFGSESDISIPVDLEGDGTADCAFYRPGTGVWYARPSSGAAPPGWQAEGGGVYTRAYGGVGGVKPVPADYDGDGQTDLAVYRPVTGAWFIDQSSVPVGDASRTLVVGWGAPEDRPTPADYDDDQRAGHTGRVDIAVYRPSTGTWYVRPWGAQAWSYVFGASDDQPLNRAALPTAAVTMTGPFPGTVLPASSPIALTADVSVSHGSVVRVEFRVDGQTVGTVTTAPYS